MYVTILSGHVTHENWVPLQKSFEKVVRHPPHGLLQSFLVQSKDDPTLWQIMSVWHNLEAFEKAEEEKTAHICVQLFCDAGSVPSRRGFSVVERYLKI